MIPDRPLDLGAESDSRILLLLLGLISTLKWADCVILLRRIYFTDQSRWLMLREKFLFATMNHNDTTATILWASCLEDPSGFYSYIPDLATKMMKENLNEQDPKQREDLLPEKTENAIPFWEKFCDENPLDIKCKIFDL